MSPPENLVVPTTSKSVVGVAVLIPILLFVLSKIILELSFNNPDV